MNLKFCGIFRDEDVEFVNKIHPDYMGMILSEGFRRTISYETAAKFSSKKSSGIKVVGVFVDESLEYIKKAVSQIKLDVVQLHGKENADMISALHKELNIPVWKAVRVQTIQDVRNAEKLGADVLILEGYHPDVIGGVGITANWDLLCQANPKQPFFLAGGLCPENVSQAKEIVKPCGIDISSGIETNGVKDFEKMKRVAEILREGEKQWKK